MPLGRLSAPVTQDFELMKKDHGVSILMSVLNIQPSVVASDVRIMLAPSSVSRIVPQGSSSVLLRTAS
ncbi:hypothetical protein scyTo_0025225, partial [Scyliorhinus torazame]|nr:hypothetical protein [Scyliorhinus torazame]